MWGLRIGVLGRELLRVEAGRPTAPSPATQPPAAAQEDSPEGVKGGTTLPVNERRWTPTQSNNRFGFE